MRLQNITCQEGWGHSRPFGPAHCIISPLPRGSLLANDASLGGAKKNLSVVEPLSVEPMSSLCPLFPSAHVFCFVFFFASLLISPCRSSLPYASPPGPGDLPGASCSTAAHIPRAGGRALCAAGHSTTALNFVHDFICPSPTARCPLSSARMASAPSGDRSCRHGRTKSLNHGVDNKGAGLLR